MAGEGMVSMGQQSCSLLGKVLGLFSIPGRNGEPGRVS